MARSVPLPQHGLDIDNVLYRMGLRTLHKSEYYDTLGRVVK